ncbi:MAG: 16S rRNA (guanine(527)-N(7))-methyltransferase RsmG [Bryocella sp.]
MAVLESGRIAELLGPFGGVEPALSERFSVYLDLLVRWNGRTNLTSVRDPEEMVRRHFGESLFAGRLLRGVAADNATLLDFGSGAGFPGLPIQLDRPELRVTLAESQNKKATFLREAVRTLGLSTEVFGGRVETMPAERTFDVVTMRAVDQMDVALPAAQMRVAPGGILCVLTSLDAAVPEGFTLLQAEAIPGANRAVVGIYRQNDATGGGLNT